MDNFAQEYGRFISSHPFERVTVGGHGFDVISAGGGRQAVVFVNCMDVYAAWIKYAEALSGKYRAVMLKYPTTLYRTAETVAALRALFKKLGIEAPVLCGAGDGGVLAQFYARRYRVSGLVMISALTAECSYAQRLRREKALLPALKLCIKSLSPKKAEEMLIKKAPKLLRGESAEEREYALSFLKFALAQADFRAALVRRLTPQPICAQSPRLQKATLPTFAERSSCLSPRTICSTGRTFGR